MRELKFRAWDKKRKVFIYIELRKNTYTCTLLSSISFPLDASEWLQFTGLKDKNGKEIYEGNIVSGRYVDDLNGETFVNEEITELDPESPCRGYWEDCEIIGNIYENPELKNLSGGKNNEKKDKPQPV